MGVVKGVRIKRNSKAIASLLSSDEVAADLKQRGERIREATGQPDKFEVVETTNRDRAVVFVKTDGAAGRRAEAEDRLLSKSVSAGR